MEKIKYIYIDDEKDNLVDSIVDNVGRDNIEIIHFESMTFKNFVDFIQKNRADFHGILFDLVLDDKKNSDGDISEYTAPVVAQYLRTLATNNKMIDLPIVLCSTEANLETLYINDLTSHNLFDMRFAKIKTMDYKRISNELKSLALGYRLISQKSTIKEIVNYEIEELDERIFSRFVDISKIPLHEISQFIMKELIFSTGPLIDENILASRLGIDIAKSNDWKTLLDNYLIPAKYTGVFDDGWERWWMNSVDKFFNDLSKTHLSYLDADKRVEFIKKETGLKDIVVADLSPLCTSKRFWTVCINTKQPLDPAESFKVAVKNDPKTWQEYNYLSPYNATERIGIDKGISVHPMDQDRLELLQDILESQK